MVRLLLTGFLVALMAVGGLGCATLVSGDSGRRSLHVTSEPSGAAVAIQQDGTWSETGKVTPTTLRLDAGDGDVSIRVSLSGYQSASTLVQSEIDPWFFGSIGLVVLFVIPGVVATGVDLASGAWKKLDRDRLHVQLEPG